MNEPLLCDDCDTIPDLIEPSLDGELSADEETRLRIHLAGCRSCTAEMALAVKIQRELRSLAPMHRGVVVPFVRPAQPESAVRGFLIAAMLALTVGGTIFLAQIRVRPAGTAQVTAEPQDVARATAEARYALAYIAKVSRHTSLDLRDGILRRRMPLTSTD